jgi:hypothetical protein
MVVFSILSNQRMFIQSIKTYWTDKARVSNANVLHRLREPPFLAQLAMVSTFRRRR